MKKAIKRPIALRSGFTLLELLIVLAILGVLAAMVIPQFLGRQKEANIRAARASIHGLEQALKLYAVNHDGEFPQGNQDSAIQMLLSPTDKSGKPAEPYLEKAPLDPWGRGFFYEYPNTKSKSTKPAIWSPGPDGKNDNGGNDDISNFSEVPS